MVFHLKQVALAIAAAGIGMACGATDQGDLPGGGNAIATGGSIAPAGTGGTTIAATGGKGGSAGVPGMVVTGSGGRTVVPGSGGSDPGGDVVETGSGGAVAMGDAGMMVPPGNSESACLDSITDYVSEGPFTFEETSEGSVKMWVPAVPAGCKVPVIHLANGTGGTCGSYGRALDHMASHGFLTTCYESGQTGAGTQGLMAFEAAVAKYPELAAMRFGSTGHSQGGQASFVVLQYAEDKFGPDALYAGLAMQPASGFGSQPTGGWQDVYAKIKSPMFMFSGTADILVSEGWVSRGFAALDDGIEAYNWSAQGATHVPTPQDAEMQVSIPWFRWKLLGDQKACEFFKAMPGNGDWEERESQNPAPCM